MSSLRRLSPFGSIAFLCLVFSNAGAATYQVGPTRTYPSVTNLPALNPGDVVQIDSGTYNAVKRWVNPGTATNPILIQGVGATRPVFDASGLNVSGSLPNPRAVFQVEASWIVIENLAFQHATNGDNGAGIRVTGANNVAIRNCRIVLCDMGIMSDNNSNLVIESSEVASNGTALYDGYSHNFYLGGNNTTLRYCYIHDALYGQNFKTRGHYTELLYNYIADSQDGEVGLVDASETAATNSHAVMIGNVVISKPRLSGYNSGRFVQFGQDSGGQHNGTLFAFNNTFVAGDSRIHFLSANAAGSSAIAMNNIFYGSATIADTTNTSGANNWMPTGASIPAGYSNTVTGSDPGFINRSARDFHLTAASLCRNQGLTALTYLDGAGAVHTGAPMMEYLSPLQGRPRPADGRLDIGAYEVFLPAFSGVSLNTTAVNLTFSTDTDRSYDLQATSNLSNASWANIATNLGGTGAQLQLTETNGSINTQRFYRLRQFP